MPGRGLRSDTHLSKSIAQNGHVSSYMLDMLHWHPFQQSISNRIIALVRWPLLWVISLSTLLSKACSSCIWPTQQLCRIVHSHKFSVVHPSLWNKLPLALCLYLRVNSDYFYVHLKTVLFYHPGVRSAPE